MQPRLVENANKLVQHVLKSISAERCLKGLEVNWTNLLGQIMAVSNSQTGMKSLNTSSYEAVFGQQYHPVLRCTVAEMWNCSSIFQHLKLSPDKRLEKYVKDNDIIDIDDPDRRGHNLQIIEEESDDIDDSIDSEGDEINDDTFPDCEKQDKIFGQPKEDKIFCQPITTEITDVNRTTGIMLDEQFNNAGVPCQFQEAFNVDTGCEEKYEANTKSGSCTYVTLNLREAWANGKVACADYPLSHYSAKEFKQICPTLTCRDCCRVGYNHKQVIMVYDKDYVESIHSSTKWWDGVFIGSFAQMTCHYTHSTINERCSTLDSTPLPQVMHVTYSKQLITEVSFMRFPSDVTQLVSVINESLHYAVMEIDVPRKRIVIFDGMYQDMLQWMNHVVSSLKRARLIGINKTCNAKDTGELTEIPGRCHQEAVRLSQGYMLSFDVSQQWKLEQELFLRQVEGYNCGPIACTKILEIFGLVTEFEIHNAYGLGTIRNLVTEQWKCFLVRCNDDLIVFMQQREPIGRSRLSKPILLPSILWISVSASMMSHTWASFIFFVGRISSTDNVS
jgi:hypothetical protein